MKRWEEFRTKLKGIRQLDEKLLVQAADIIGNPGQYVQFCRDVQLYDLYQAVLMIRCEDTTREELANFFLPIVAEERKIVLPPPSSWTNREFHGQVKTHTDGEFRPDVTWRIRIDMILERHDKLTFSDGTKKSRLESLLSSAISDQSLVDKTMKLSRINFREAIESLPYAIRIRVMARIIKSLDIPPPVNPTKKFDPIFKDRHDPEGPERFQAFVLDEKGNAWHWNCGWRRVGENGQWLDNKPPLPHSVFRRAIKLATTEQLGLTSFRYTRPHGQWRRASARIHHRFWGNGEMEMTDGLHAIVKFDDGKRREIVLQNTETIGVKIPARLRDKAPRKPTKKEISLKEIQDIVGSILG